MRLLRSVKDNELLKAGTVASIGNFDGVHKGHQALLARLMEKAKWLGLPSLLVLFEPQPGEYFKQAEAPVRLSSLREKLACLKKAGVDYVLCLKFNKQLAQMDARTFAKHYLFQGIHCRYLLTGEDFRFGYQREGDLNLLQALAKKYHSEVAFFPAYQVDKQRVSSTLVRKALASAALDEAANYLGRPYSVCARVVKGAGLGRQWGIPTANMLLNRPSFALNGVYLVRVLCQGHLYNAVANIGTRPTVDGSEKKLEVYILDFSSDIYGEMLEVFFLRKLRNEVKFESVEQLVTQIKQDIQAAEAFFSKAY